MRGLAMLHCLPCRPARPLGCACSKLESPACASLPPGRTSTIQHWQLRDLLHCPDADTEVYCVHRHRTLRYDINNDRVRRVARPARPPQLLAGSNARGAARGGAL